MKLFYLSVVFVVVFGSRGNTPISYNDINEQHGDSPSYAHGGYNSGYSLNGGNNFFPYDAHVNVHNSGNGHSPYGGQGKFPYRRQSRFGHKFGHLAEKKIEKRKMNGFTNSNIVSSRTANAKLQNNESECLRKCKAWRVNYWQRFCNKHTIRLYCDDNYFLKIQNAQYGNIPCHPSNVRYNGLPSCQADRGQVLKNTRDKCDYRKQCTAKVDNKLFAKGYIYHHKCSYHVKSITFYAEYECRPSITLCQAFCKCRHASSRSRSGYGKNSAAYCKKKYKNYLHY